MTNSKFFITLSLLVLIGIFFGVIISVFNKQNPNINLVENNEIHISGNQLKNSDSPQSFLLNNNNIPSGDHMFNSSYSTSSQSSDSDNLSQNALLDQTTKLAPQNVKAVYLTGWSAGTKSKRMAVIDNLKKYNFNAVVIDIKDEAGNISYNSNVKTAIDISASKNMISDIQSVINDFHDAEIYVIGRIVTFKDPNYAKKVPKNAYKSTDGSLWYDYSGNNWPNPYNTESWEYPIELAIEAANLGFDEIQFDYIRFPSSEGRVRNIAYGFNSDTQSKSDTVNAFLKQVMEKLSPYNVVVSADVFGITTKKMGDFEHIGQDFCEIAKIVDVICPMIYPSHYGFGEYGISKPDTEPYKIVKGALADAQKQYNQVLNGVGSEQLLTISGDNINTNNTITVSDSSIANESIKLATIRPYLQDFTASWLKKGNYILYDTKAVTAQLQACYDLDIHDFILWDPSNKYSYEAINNITFKDSGDSLEI